MGLLEMLLGQNGKDSAVLEKKLDEVTRQLKRMENSQKTYSQAIVKELKDLRTNNTLSREEVIKRVESLQEKLQFATEEYIATDEDIKQMVRNCLRSKAKTFNEIQKETKISPQTLAKYLKMMKNEVEEYNGVYRVVMSSSIVYANKLGTEDEQDQSLFDLVESDALYGEKR